MADLHIAPLNRVADEAESSSSPCHPSPPRASWSSARNWAKASVVSQQTSTQTLGGFGGTSSPNHSTHLPLVLLEPNLLLGIVIYNPRHVAVPRLETLLFSDPESVLVLLLPLQLHSPDLIAHLNHEALGSLLSHLLLLILLTRARFLLLPLDLLHHLENLRRGVVSEWISVSGQDGP